MTKEERLQKLAKLIYQQHKAQEPLKGYANGDTIELFSIQIELSADVDSVDQTYALDVLRDTYKCIQYSSVKGYKNKSELSPYAHTAIAEIANENGLSFELVEREFIKTVIYRIEVFDTIDDVINILGGLLCELTVENGVTPVVTVRGTKHRLQSLQDGSMTQRIVEYASKGRYDTNLKGGDFKKLNIAQLTTSNYNVVQIFKNNIFGKTSTLGDFATATPKTFLLKKRVLLSEEKISAIQKLAH